MKTLIALLLTCFSALGASTTYFDQLSAAGFTNSGLTASQLMGTDANKGQVSITTSAFIAASISDETGSGALVFGTSPTIVTPTIASFANANHNHQNSAGGGALDTAALTSGTLAAARMPALTGPVTTSAGAVATIMKCCVGIACSDETTALTTGTAKATFRMPYAMTVTEVRATLTTAQASGSIFTVNVKESGTTIFSTKVTIDNTELTSTTAVTLPVLSDSSLADDAQITVDIDQIGASGATGLKLWIIGTR